MSGSSDLKYLVTPFGAVFLPMLQALVSGITAFAIAISLAWYFESDKPLVIASLAGSGVFAVGWLAGVSWWRNRVTNAKEKEQQAQVFQSMTRVEVISQDPSGAFIQGAWADFPISQEKLIKMARRVEAGASFTHADLAGNHRPLSRSEFETVRSEFIARGLCHWVNPDAHTCGVSLSRAGQAVCRRMSELPIDPPTTHHAKIIPGKLLDAGGLHMHAYMHKRLGR